MPSVLSIIFWLRIYVLAFRDHRLNSIENGSVFDKYVKRIAAAVICYRVEVTHSSIAIIGCFARYPYIVAVDEQ